MDTILQDIRYAFRQLIGNPSTTIIAVLTLALGIGANMSVMSLINATLFKPARAVDPEQLVWVMPRMEQNGRYGSWSYPNYTDFTNAAQSYSGVLAFGHQEFSVGGDSPQRARGLTVSGNYFDVIGVRVGLGRWFRASDDVPGAPPVVLIGHGFWATRFGSDSGVIGRQLTLNAHQYTIVGVAPRNFADIALGEPSDVWLTIHGLAQLNPDEGWRYTSRNSGWLRVVARLKPDQSRERAESEARVIATRLQPDSTAPDERRTLAVAPVAGGLDPSNRAEGAPILALVMVVPLLVLVVACANVANLFVARGVRRRKELAVRRALGASRGRLVRQLLTECVMLAAAAGFVGMTLSSWLTLILSRVAAMPPDVAPALVPDSRVFIATFVLAIVAGGLFGLLPSLAATRTELTPALKNESVTLRVGRSRHYLRNTFVVGQVAVSLLLLITAGLFVGSLTKALKVDPGFDPRNTVSLRFDLQAEGYTEERISLFQRRLLDDLSATTGIESVALANVIPLSNRAMGNAIQREGAAENDDVGSQLSAVTTGFFTTMRIPFARGRAFTAEEVASDAPVIVINETLARRFWPDADPLGKRVRVGGRAPWREVVGVVRNGKYRSLAEVQAVNYFFVPASARDLNGDVTLVARGVGDAKATVSAVTSVIRRLDANVPVYRIATLEENLAGTVDTQRAGAALLGVFGALALALAALGLFGVISQGVASRTREIGIRMSLGARAADVVTAFVREGIVLTAIGAVIGVGLSIAISSVLATLLFGLTPTDALTFTYAVGALTLVALVSAWIPARRAARVDPLIALRQE